MAYSKRLVGALGLLLLVQCGEKAGRDDGENAAACRQLCEGRCSAFAGCGLEARAGCVDECAASLQYFDCEFERPADQLTCDELEEIAACTNYCTEFCARATECGSFDRADCLGGCTDEQPLVCNPASVAVRTCDQLKPEARVYADAGRSLRDDGFASGHSYDPEAFGLCRNPDDCDLPLTCLPATNTCGACSQASDCERGSPFEAYVCSNGECLDVECAINDDCILGVCDLATYTCVDCVSDADCSTGFRICDTAVNECVECTSDAHCSAATPRCDLVQSRCRECLSDADCTDASQPACISGGFCSFG